MCQGRDILVGEARGERKVPLDPHPGGGGSRGTEGRFYRGEAGGSAVAFSGRAAPPGTLPVGLCCGVSPAPAPQPPAAASDRPGIPPRRSRRAAGPGGRGRRSPAAVPPSPACPRPLPARGRALLPPGGVPRQRPAPPRSPGPANPSGSPGPAPRDSPGPHRHGARPAGLDRGLLWRWEAAACCQGGMAGTPHSTRDIARSPQPRGSRGSRGPCRGTGRCRAAALSAHACAGTVRVAQVSSAPPGQDPCTDEDSPEEPQLLRILRIPSSCPARGHRVPTSGPGRWRASSAGAGWGSGGSAAPGAPRSRRRSPAATAPVGSAGPGRRRAGG